MQINCLDYYEICRFGEGCCLKCPNAEEGCLCPECRCTKCFWYTPPEEHDGEKGHCDKTDELIKEKRRKWKKNIIYLEKRDNLLYSKKQKAEKEKNFKGIKNYYACQECGFEIASEKEIIIKPNKYPLCDGCGEKIGITEEEKIKLKKEIEEELNTPENIEWINNI